MFSLPCVTGAAVGFKLDSLLKLADTRTNNNKMTLLHYLAKVTSVTSMGCCFHSGGTAFS